MLILLAGCQNGKESLDTSSNKVQEKDIDSSKSDQSDSDQSDSEKSDSEVGVFTSQKVDIVRTKDDTDLDEKPSSSKKKKIYFTFDDGPSSNTQTILDILDKYNIKATFFVQGKTGEYAKKAYKRIADEGHSLGMHSYTHKYTDIYASKESFAEDITRLQEYLYEETGVWSRLYRFPGGSSNKVSKVPMDELIAYLDNQGIRYFDWNVSADDAVSGGLSKEKIIQNCLGPIDKYDECVILMHDALDKKTTLYALEEIIKKLIARGDCEILPITDETVPVQHVKK